MAGEPSETSNAHSSFGLVLGEGGREVGSTFPSVGWPGDAAGRRQRVTHSLPLGWDPANSGEGVIDAEVLDVDRHLGPKRARYLAKDGPCGASGGQDD